MFGEVGLLSRHIRFQGLAAAANLSDWSEATFGGHIMITMARLVEVVGIEVTRMGQQGVLGRYRTYR